ncbi:MAG: cytochrome biogenesis protein [Gammaproteobacteria bacterium]|nr:MAG: cytochrome biogenesis protein [Gammaproteobacteria bacterium]
MIETTLLGVFLVGLFGGVHCVGMCGGIVAALGLMNRRPATEQQVALGDLRTAAATSRITGKPHGNALVSHASATPVSTATTGPTGNVALSLPQQALPALAWRQVGTALGYNLGRLSTYTALGAAVGSVGSLPFLIDSTLPVQQAAFTFTNLLLVLMGLYLAGWRRLGLWIERLGQAFWQPIAPAATRWLQRPGLLASVATGALWGLVPCGLVYGVLVAALGSGSAGNGALLMLTFGLGTLPNLLAMSLAASSLASWLRRPGVRLAAGFVVAAFGILGFLRSETALSIPILGELCSHLP